MIHHIALQNFRIFQKQCQYDIGSTVTFIRGPNGTGKTSLLEAIYFGLVTKGFRETELMELINHNADDGYVIVDKNEIRYKKQFDRMARSFFIDHTKATQTMYIAEQQPVVLFAPQQLVLIILSPAYRRLYFDEVLSRLFPTYRSAVRAYTQSLRARNKILEEWHDKDKIEQELFFWDTQLDLHSASITTQRQACVDFYNKQTSLCGHCMHMQYDSHPFRIAEVRTKRAKELAARRTLYGNQRDDFQITFDTYNVHTYGSRSQQRLALLWLKLREIVYAQQVLSRAPLLLLDDVLSEFDDTHQQVLFETMHTYQTVVTATDAEKIPQDATTTLLELI